MIEPQLQQALFNSQSEKTFIDKLLSRQDVEAIREIIKKPKLKREDLLEVLYLISGVESKVLNYGAWDRYVILKFFVWIREFVKVAELLYDYQDKLELKNKQCWTCKKYVKVSAVNDYLGKCSCKTPKLRDYMSARTKTLLYNNERLIEHNAKFLIDLYLNIGRTSLSLGGTGFLEILKNKYEVAYTGNMGGGLQTPVNENKSGGLFSFRKG